MAIPEATAGHYARQQRLTAAALTGARSSWSKINPNSLDRSWALVGPRFLVTATAIQRAAALDAVSYVPAVLAELDIDSAPAGRVGVGPLLGVSSDGRPLSTLLHEPIVRTKALIGQGASTSEALASGLAMLERIVATQIPDAARAAAGIAIAARPRVGYVRMLNPPSCSRCAVLAGKWFRYNQGFQRHPRCFPAGVVVSGPQSLATTRRWYEGELTIITTASGKRLPATGNHPILTDHGWVPANLLSEGDNVISGSGGQGAAPLVVPDVRQMPSRIEDVSVPFGVALHGMPTTAEDFHGDGGHGEVDAVLADSLLRHRELSTLGQPPSEHSLTFRMEAAGSLASGGSLTEHLVGLLDAADGMVRSGSLIGSLGSGHLPGSHLASVRHPSCTHASLGQVPADHTPADPVAAAEAVLALAALVRRSHLGDGQNEVATRWDAPASPFTVESREAYARRGEDLRLRLAGQISSDRIVELRRVQWSGHVYNLTSSEGWYEANGLIVSNCDCRHIPATEDVAGDLTTDPRKAIEAGQVNGLSKADTRAIIDDHADVGQVINARRGMTAAGTTTEGTTRRGFAGKRLGAQAGARSLAAGTRFGNATAVRARSAPRLMPERIYELAGDDRDRAIDLLRRNGYLI